jgi:hypothetical protein
MSAGGCDHQGWLSDILALVEMKIGASNLRSKLAGSWIRKRPHGIMIKSYMGFLE